MSSPSNFNGASIFQAGFPTISEDFSYGPEDSYYHKQNPNTVLWNIAFLQNSINEQFV